MKQLAVLIDIDDTLADSQTVLLEHVNRVSSRPYTLSYLTQASREDDDDEYNKHVRELLRRPEIVASYQPFYDALQAVTRLHAAGYAVHICSSRKENLHETTTDWLAEHGFAPFIAKVHPRMSINRGHDFKVSVARSVQAVVAFDDTYEVVVALSQVVPTVYLIERPWNQDGDTPDNVTRHTSFATAVFDFLAYEQ